MMLAMPPSAPLFPADRLSLSWWNMTPAVSLSLPKTPYLLAVLMLPFLLDRLLSDGHSHFDLACFPLFAAQD